MKVCFDINVVIDIIARSSKYPESFFSCDIANLRKFDTCVLASSMTDIAYLLHRFGQSKAQVKNSMKAIFALFDMIDVNGSDCCIAIDSAMEDFEDAVVAASSQRNGVDMMITRNVADFKDSPVPAISPEDFVKQFCPPGYEYDAVDM